MDFASLLPVPPGTESCFCLTTSDKTSSGCVEDAFSFQMKSGVVFCCQDLGSRTVDTGDSSVDGAILEQIEEQKMGETGRIFHCAISVSLDLFPFHFYALEGKP